MTVLEDNPADGRFEWREGGHIAFVDYRRADGRLIIDHVEAPSELRGTGAAGRLMQAVADFAHGEGVKITPLCSYARAWLQRDPANTVLLG